MTHSEAELSALSSPYGDIGESPDKLGPGPLPPCTAAAHSHHHHHRSPGGHLQHTTPPPSPPPPTPPSGSTNNNNIHRERQYSAPSAGAAATAADEAPPHHDHHPHQVVHSALSGLRSPRGARPPPHAGMPPLPGGAGQRRSLGLMSRRGLFAGGGGGGSSNGGSPDPLFLGGIRSGGPTRVESDMILDDLADGIQCQSPVGLMATLQTNKKQGTSFRVKTVRKYVCGPTIGEGSYGKVRLAIDQQATDGNSGVVALKVVQRRKLKKTRGGDDMLFREAAMQRKLNASPHTMTLLDFFEDEAKGKIYFVFPYAVGSLQRLIEGAASGRGGGGGVSHFAGAGLLPLEVVASLAAQLLRGLAHMHRRRVIHRDVKPPNCMLMPDNTLVLSDFGAAEELPKGSDGWTKGGSATPAYQPPEVARGEVRFCGYAADVWSAGVTVYQMLALELPFHGSNPFKTYEAIVHNDVSFEKADRGHEEVGDFLRRVLAKEPTVRPSAAQLVRHALFEGTAAAAEEESDFDDDDDDSGRGGGGGGGGDAAGGANAPAVPAAAAAAGDAPEAEAATVSAAARNRSAMAGLHLDWRSGRRAKAAVEAGPGSVSDDSDEHDAAAAAAPRAAAADPFVPMHDDSLDLQRSFCAALSVALESHLLHEGEAVTSYLHAHDYYAPCDADGGGGGGTDSGGCGLSTPDSPLLSPLQSPTSSAIQPTNDSMLSDPTTAAERVLSAGARSIPNLSLVNASWAGVLPDARRPDAHTVLDGDVLTALIPDALRTTSSTALGGGNGRDACGKLHSYGGVDECSPPLISPTTLSPESEPSNPPSEHLLGDCYDDRARDDAAAAAAAAAAAEADGKTGKKKKAKKDKKKARRGGDDAGDGDEGSEKHRAWLCTRCVVC